MVVIGIGWFVIFAGLLYYLNSGFKMYRDTVATSTYAVPEKSAGVFTLTSPVFTDGDSLPALYTCDRKPLISPPLVMRNPPADTKYFVLIMTDDATGFVHWLVYDLPVSKTRLLDGDPIDTKGRNGNGDLGYIGPCPPHGADHAYSITYYALDSKLGFPPGKSADEIRAAMEGHVTGEARITAHYAREEI